MRAITKRTLAWSGLVALLMTVVGLSLQVLESLLVGGSGPPRLDRLVGLIACYLAAMFTYALGFFILLDKLPGRSVAGRGLRYAGLVLTAVWISGFINLAAVDYDGGWNLLSPLKVDAFWMGVIDCSNILLGGLVLGFIARKEERMPPPAAFTPNLAMRIAAGAIMLPAMCAGAFHIVVLLIPVGVDLSGDKGPVFYVFLFIPLIVSGAGTALFHDVLRSGQRRGIVSGSSRSAFFLFFLYWIPNVIFVLFFGYTWQMVTIFYVAMASALLVSLMALEGIARVRPGEARP